MNDTDLKIRNIAVIAHVDHGKTTLVDSFLKKSNIYRDNEKIMNENLIMDSGDLERERGITITSKNLSIPYKDYKINIIDTPGHADFGGEVERVLNMADGCLLIVDAQEGPMPQTRFVLKKAIEMNKKIIVVVNKIDKKFVDIDKTLSRIYDLFLELAVNENQLEFPIYYAIAREGKISETLPKSFDDMSDVTILFDGIIKYIPAPDYLIDLPFLMQVSSIEYDNYLGQSIIGKILQGSIQVGMDLNVIDEDMSMHRFKVSKLLENRGGTKKEEVMEAFSGDIVTIIGASDVKVGDTIAVLSHKERLPDIKIQEPSVKVAFEANTSPLVGREGDIVTSRKLLERLNKEMEKNVAMKLDIVGESYLISGRGELHISILIETLRREGYEFQISKPEAIEKNIDGKIYDSREELIIDVPKEFIGEISSELAKRSAELSNMVEEGEDRVRFYYKILTKNLFGLRNDLINKTKGMAIINHNFLDFIPFSKGFITERNGVLISTERGIATAYSLNNAQDRGELFISPGTEVYEGMILGINKYQQDMDVNVIKEKHATNMHTEKTDDSIVLYPPIPLTIEYGMNFIEDDELMEITPKNIRLRKKILNKSQRVKKNKS